jgi:hypothetical protein
MTNGARSGNPVWVPQQKGRYTVARKGIRREWKLLLDSAMAHWGRSVNDLLAAASAKYKGLTAISWLNIHRLYDFRRWQFVRFRLFLWRKDVNMFIHRNLFLSK